MSYKITKLFTAGELLFWSPTIFYLDPLWAVFMLYWSKPHILPLNMLSTLLLHYVENLNFSLLVKNYHAKV